MKRTAMKPSTKPMSRGQGFKPKTPSASKAPAPRAKPEPGRRKRKCAVCREPFEPRSMMHKACKPECAIEHAESIRKAQERKTDRERRTALKTRQDWLREAQAVFNAFIRARDHAEPCISCGRFHTGSYDAGHYRSVGAQPALRFDENNVHKQCVPCNQHRGGNIVEYRIRLLLKIGRVAVEWLETEHQPLKLDVPQIQSIKAHYAAKLKQLKKEIEMSDAIPTAQPQGNLV